MKALHKLTHLFQRIFNPLLEWTVITLVIILVLDVTWGVVSRFVIKSPSRWTEELARYVLMWVVLFGTAVAFHRREHLGFDYVAKQIDPSARKLLGIVAELITIAFASLVMIYGGYVLVSETLTANQVTPALGLRMGHIYLAVPMSGIFIVIFCLDHLFELLLQDEASSTDTPLTANSQSE